MKKDAETAPNTSGVKYVEGYKSGNFYYNGYIKGVGATGNVSQGNTVGTIGKKQQLQSLTLYLYPIFDVPAAWPFFAQPSQPYPCTCAR